MEHWIFWDEKAQAIFFHQFNVYWTIFKFINTKNLIHLSLLLFFSPTKCRKSQVIG
ncbi:hypothetical protein CsatB_028442 [Cannabis sativa]